MKKNIRKDLLTGKIGETVVLLKLLELGYDAFNLNNEFRNFKNADLMCFKPETGKYTMIQVKASAERTPNFYTGFNSDRNGDIIGNKNLDENIVCPWVFVHILEDNGEKKYKYYILTKEEVSSLIIDSNKWYWKEGGSHFNATKDVQQVALPIGWITGRNIGKNGGKQYPRNIKIDEAENAWDKITKLLE